MAARTGRTKLAILKALAESETPAGASRITAKVLTTGTTLSPRTVRHYLLQMDGEGLTRFVSRRRGREITERGREEIEHANIVEKIGFVAAKVDVLGYKMSFDLDSNAGTVVTNVVVLAKNDLSRALEHMEPVFEKGLGMGRKLIVAFEGEEIGRITVPEGSVAVGTVCSVTVNGALLKRGVPVTSRFGGLVEFRDGQPTRFVQLMEYRGTTIDPLEVFIGANMTRVRECAETGSGIVGASFREVPTVALGDVRKFCEQMTARDLGAVVSIGIPNRPLLDIPVAEGRTGMIVMAGLNPIAALHEAGVPLSIQALAGLEDISEFSVFEDVALKGRRDSPMID